MADGPQRGTPGGMADFLRAMMPAATLPEALTRGLVLLVGSGAGRAALIVDDDGRVIAVSGIADLAPGAQVAPPGSPADGRHAGAAGLNLPEPIRALHVLPLASASGGEARLAVIDPRSARGRLIREAAEAMALVRDLRAGRATADPLGALSVVFNDSPVPMWVYRRDNLRFLRVNGAAERLYGWSAADFATMSLLDVRAPEERERIRRIATGRAEVPWSGGPFTHRDADGVEHHVEVDAVPIDYGGIPARLATLRCVTDRVEAERSVREAQRLARIATWRLDVSDRGLRLSGCLPPPWDTLAGSPRGALRHLLRAIDRSDRAGLGAAVRRCLQDGEGVAAEFRLAMPDGRSLHCRAAGERRSLPRGGVVLQGYAQDITPQRAAETALRQADRLSAMGQLTGGIAHDFNNLLTVIGANIELVRDAVEAPALRRLLTAAGAAVEHGAALTGQLLSFAGRRPQRPAIVDLDGFLSEFGALLARSLGPAHRIDMGGVAPGLCVFCDRTQLESALLNLVLNARDALQEGGPIRLGARRDPDGQAPGGLVALSVRDEGVGMAPEVALRVAEPFFTTKPPGQGTGLGLSMAFGFAEQSGGSLTIDTAPGVGTTVTLLLPESDPASAPAAPSGAAPSVPPLRVLVVEDDASVRSVATAALERMGLTVSVATTAEEALARLAEGLAVDLLFTDIVLGPGLDGYALARRVLAGNPGVAVLFASGYHQNPEAHTGDPVLARWELLPKPYRIATLQAALARAAAMRDDADARRE